MGDQIPITTIVPFANTAELPACAAACGPLYDANGGCVPPAIPTAPASVYTQCFCLNSNVRAFSTATTGICDDACTAQPDGLGSIVSWFRSICDVTEEATTTDNTDTATGTDSGTTTTGTGSSSGDKSGSKNGGGGDWLSGHWQYVIMLVVLVVGIAGIWVGACIWRRRYLKKKDRQTSLGQKQSGSVRNPSWGPGVGEAQGATNPALYAHDSAAQGVFMPGAAVDAEKGSGSKKWIPGSRT